MGTWIAFRAVVASQNHLVRILKEVRVHLSDVVEVEVPLTMLVLESLALSKDAEIPKAAASVVEEPVMISEVELASCCFVIEHQMAGLDDRMMAKRYRDYSEESRGSWMTSGPHMAVPVER